MFGESVSPEPVTREPEFIVFMLRESPKVWIVKIEHGQAPSLTGSDGLGSTYFFDCCSERERSELRLILLWFCRFKTIHRYTLRALLNVIASSHSEVTQRMALREKDCYLAPV